MQWESSEQLFPFLYPEKEVASDMVDVILAVVRFRIPEFQPDRRADSLRERGTAVGLSWLPEGRTQAEGDGSPRPDEYRPSCRTFSAAAIRRTTATCGDSARRGDGLSADPCRRTDGKPGFDKRGGGDGITSRTERAGDDDRHGHALGTGCQLRTPDYPSFGRPGRFLNIHL